MSRQPSSPPDSLRNPKPNFPVSLGPNMGRGSRVLNSLSNVVDALNTIRNHASVAHPNENLLDEAEAMLMVNVTRTLFHYINAKV
jgi:hypothetical protein